jgi:hypothetical protein
MESNPIKLTDLAELVIQLNDSNLPVKAFRQKKDFKIDFHNIYKGNSSKNNLLIVLLELSIQFIYHKYQ